MKTAVSLPDPLFRRVDRLAKRRREPRSAIFREALEEYLARHEGDAITESYRRLCEEVDTRPDPVWREAYSRVLRSVEW